MSWYRDGTVSVTNGSTNVTGAGTLWAAQVSSGDLFSLDGDKFYEVDSVTDDTHVMLKTAYAGATAAGQSYAIIRNFTSTLPAQLASKLADLMTKYHVTLDEFISWLAGTGTVTIHDPADVPHQVKSAGQLAAESSGMLTKSVAGNADVVLTDAEASNAFLMLTGTLTGNINIIVPAATKEWIVKNATTGNYTLTVKTAGGTGRAVRQNGLESIWCDGTNVLRTDSDSTKADLAGATFTGPVLVPSLQSGASGANAANADFVNAAVAGKDSLVAISQSLHVGAIVASYLYDTSKDSDGGAWRKRCADKSWYTETINGVWLGQAASAAAAWALAGAVQGAYFQSTTDGKFYTLGAASPTVTETFRGNVREFPEQVAIIAESSRVVIYDLTQSGCPMWMSLFVGTSGVTQTFLQGSITSVACLDGALAAASNSVSSLRTGVQVVRFIGDDCLSYGKSGSGSYAGRHAGNISQRNAFTSLDGSLPVIVSEQVNSVAMTVLLDAPIDAATGLPIPTIAVTTEGGISVIKSDGTVVNSAITSSFKYASITPRFRLTVIRNVGGSRDVFGFPLEKISSGFTTADICYGDNEGTRFPPYIMASSTVTTAIKESVASGGVLGLSLARTNPSAPTSGMSAYITSAYNTGWMVGDIRGAWLADTVVETVTGSGELIANGTFTTDMTGWTLTTATAAASGGKATLTNDATGTNVGYMSYAFTTVVGKAYRVSIDYIKGTAAQTGFRVGTTLNGSSYNTQGSTTSATLTCDFVASTTTTYLTVYNNTTSASVTSQYDNASCKLISPDRSVKNHGLIVNGSLTKAAAATGAQLVAYSGFSTSNYLEQPYNADLDFGTGDFCITGWATWSGLGTGGLFDRYDVAQSGSRLYIGVSGGNWVLICATSNSPITTGVAAPSVGIFHFSLVRASGVLSLYINGVSVYSAANTANITNTSGVVTIGHSSATTSAAWAGSIALLRVSATAPSLDQIAHIYNTEKHLFDTGAKCTIDGTSAAVTALAYDDTTDTLQVGTSWGRSAFRDLVRVESAATQTGAITSLSAGQGAHITGGASSARYYQPAMYLRDELRRRDEARRALGKVPVFIDVDAASGQTTFAAPKGYSIKAVYSAGALKRLGSTKDYTVSYDGFTESAVFGVAPGSGVWVSLMCVRSK